MKKSSTKTFAVTHRPRKESSTKARQRGIPRPSSQQSTPSQPTLTHFQRNMRSVKDTPAKLVQVIKKRGRTVTQILLRNAREATYSALADVYAAHQAIEELKPNRQEEVYRGLGCAKINRGSRGELNWRLRALLIAMTNHERPKRGAGGTALRRDAGALEYAVGQGLETQEFVTEISKPGQGVEAWNKKARPKAMSPKSSPTQKPRTLSRSKSSHAPTADGDNGSGGRPKPWRPRKPKTKYDDSARRQLCRPGLFLALIKIRPDSRELKRVLRAELIAPEDMSDEAWDDLARQANGTETSV